MQGRVVVKCVFQIMFLKLSKKGFSYRPNYTEFESSFLYTHLTVPVIFAYRMHVLGITAFEHE